MAAIAWRESPAVRSAGQSDGRRSQSHQRNWVAKSRDEHAGCKEWRREGKYPPDGRRPPGALAVSPAVADRRHGFCEEGATGPKRDGLSPSSRTPRPSSNYFGHDEPTWRDHEPSQQPFYPTPPEWGTAIQTKLIEWVWIIINPLESDHEPRGLVFCHR